MLAGDIQQMFGDSLIQHKGLLKYFVGYSQASDMALLTNIETGRAEKVPFVFEEFSAPNVRLGYVNDDSGAMYWKRVHVRQYKMGFTMQNIKTGGVHPNFLSPGFRAMVRNDYPSLMDAYQIASQFGVTTAFDKQFAIAHPGHILFKGNRVGVCRDGEVLAFDKDWNFLNNLIGEGYASRFRSNRSS